MPSRPNESRRPRVIARSRAEKLSLHFFILRAPFFLLKGKTIFLRGRPPLCGGWRRVSKGFAFWIYVSDLAK
ncbi:MAG: hypothetical protein A3J64_01750 [Candidatus Portnoybacteria bacterium RIFCSPHIGHO2_12_FULL_38_9]|uniref:Uncharacterized protein n=1 Tax=Candidatus Portnoybacteria bacterium RIFCSPHIGHO2_12_FULL_38_9 TaxID=1801997 RepID=A0A1G2FHU9_9BACT|nr:MAG: hypothetical protein A3J64_01750 [Candidatus Portnoybacteria bacterium RIFCSPHIGHO2_12_FULL_38_9]